MFIVAEEGYRYDGEPGKHNFSVTQYKQYAVALPQENETYISTDSDALPMLRLIRNPNHDLRYHTELEWRLALPISAILLAILAQLLSRVEPRHGRFQRLIPAILIYIVYANMLFVGRNWMYHAKTPEWLGIWWVHVGLILFILALGYKKLR
jgi:lipopolysaccharide export system permease protein